ncbi:MAG: hypothetical protein WDO68_06375 [Gammaproteobacteria bacterium]
MSAILKTFPNRSVATESPVRDEPDDLNPLWVVIAGMAWLFGVMVAIMAFT